MFPSRQIIAGLGPLGEANGDGSDATMHDVYGVIGTDGTGTATCGGGVGSNQLNKASDITCISLLLCGL